MDIKFVYPDMTADEFMAAVAELNEGIEDRNRLAFMPRLVAAGFAIFMYALTAAAVFIAWKLIVFLITGRDVYTIATGLIIFALMIPSSFSLQKRAAPHVKKLLLKVLKLRDYEERFTLNEYADRDEESKKLNKDLKLYRFCDEVRDKKVQDASVHYDGEECEVDMSFWDEDTGSSVIRRIRLPARILEDTDGITVDFEQRTVWLPSEGDFV